MNICFVVEGYPTSNDPFMTFIRELVVQVSKEGHNCTVVAPQSISREIKLHVPRRPKMWKDYYSDSEYIQIYQPFYFSFSNYLSEIVRRQIVFQTKRTLKCISKRQKIDVLYAHFWHMAVIASEACETLPIIVASGEDVPTVRDRFPESMVEKMIARVKGVVYVANNSYEGSRRLGLQKNQPYIIAPNGFNPDEYKPIDRIACRQYLGFKPSDMIVSFVGSFDNRKGINRLSTALSYINNEKGYDVKSIFIGSGNIQPTCPGVLFVGKVPHDKIPQYLCASDFFVLPTNSEGCCNAIIEAIGCGLPVISSDLAFNDDILDNSCSIRINTNDETEISMAIIKLLDENLRHRLSDGAIKKSVQLSIVERSRRIISFIQDII